jgi:hypothetical protein
MPLCGGKVIQPPWGKVQIFQMPETGNLCICIIGKQGIVRNIAKELDDDGQVLGLDFPALVRASAQEPCPERIGHGKPALQQRALQPGLRRLSRVLSQKLSP